MQSGTGKEVHAVIPARYGSTRLPGKPMLMLEGKPMFWHVWQRTRLCPLFSSVTVATDSQIISDTAEQLEIPCIMTQPDHPSGTDRVYEAARKLNFSENAIVVNVQGDEPALNPAALSELLSAFNDQSVQAATLATPLAEEEAPDPNRVKVILNASGNALYFSRSPIPFARSTDVQANYLGHIGIYAFTTATLATFVNLPPSPLEQTEQLEQLRLLENDIPIKVILTNHSFHGVDTETDIAPVLSLMQRHSC